MNKGGIVASSTPTHWATYIDSLKTPTDIDTNLARFRARYRMAMCLESVQFNGYSRATIDAYTSALRVSLAYSALETLEGHPEIEARSITINSADLAQRFRSQRLAKLRAWLEEEDQHPKLAARVGALISGGNDHVRPVVEAIRNKTFHGSLTAHGTGIAQSKTTLVFLDDLAAGVLQSADERFTQLVIG